MINVISSLLGTVEIRHYKKSDAGFVTYHAIRPSHPSPHKDVPNEDYDSRQILRIRPK